MLTVAFDRAVVQLRFMAGDADPALGYLERFRRTAGRQPVSAQVGDLRGYSSQTAVADLHLLTPLPVASPWAGEDLVVKFELYPSHILHERLAAERRNELLARRYLDRFMPATLRVIGHGLDGLSSALVYQPRVSGKLLRQTSWHEIRDNPRLQRNLLEFCDCVWQMAQEVGRIPDIAGTLPRIDHLSNFFWRSRNVMVDPAAGDVWLVDTGWKEGQELLHGGPWRPRLRTRFRLWTLRLLRWRVARLRPLLAAGVTLIPAFAPLEQSSADLLIAIVNWNTRDLLSECLASIAAEAVCLTHRRIETIVIDNASSDDSVAIVRERFPQVRVIENHTNVGFARANNQAIEKSDSCYVLVLNSDTKILPGALETLLAFMDAHPCVGAVGARLLNGNGSLQESCRPMLTPEREFWRLMGLDALWPTATYRMTRWGQVTPHPVEVISGACLLLRRAALDQIGLLDETYFMYTEEVDLCYRLAQAGWELWWVPQAEIIHYGGASSKQAAEAMYVQLYRSKVQFYRKFGGEARADQFKHLVRLAYWPRWAAARLGGYVKPSLGVQVRTYRRLLAELPGM
jgi:GT2 family glycosyltransferase